jgi:Cytochrome c554 and c-prime
MKTSRTQVRDETQEINMKTFVRRVLWIAAALVVAAAPLQGATPSFVGAKKCKACHLKEFNSWAESRMAKSFDLLKPGVNAAAKKKAKLDPDKDYTKDATCLACHTTGYGKTGGFVDIATTPDLAGVGCEMCHGPGGTYLQKEYMSLQNKEFKKASLVAVGLVGQITKDQCAGCHNTKSPFVGKDYVFDFVARKTKGTHEKFPLKYAH